MVGEPSLKSHLHNCMLCILNSLCSFTCIQCRFVCPLAVFKSQQLWQHFSGCFRATKTPEQSSGKSRYADVKQYFILLLCHIFRCEWCIVWKLLFCHRVSVKNSLLSSSMSWYSAHYNTCAWHLRLLHGHFRGLKGEMWIITGWACMGALLRSVQV